MKRPITGTLEIIKGSEAEAKIKQADPVVYTLLDEIGFDKLEFIRMCVPWGMPIYEKSIFYFPSKEGMVPLNHSTISSDIQSRLDYSVVPLGIITEGCFEVSSEIGNSMFPLAHRRNGLSLGMWEMFSLPSPFTVTSGARSAFFLSSTNEIEGYRRLKKKYDLASSRPKSMLGLYYQLRDIVNHPNFTKTWLCEIFLLTKETYNNILKNENYLKLNNFILKNCLEHTRPERRKTIHNAVLKSFINELAKKKNKPQSYQIALLEYLIDVADGVLPGFKIVTDDIPLPYTDIIKTYLEDYRLKDYIPTMLYTDYFDYKKNDVVYISLPVLDSLLHNSRNEKSTYRQELVKIIELLDEFFVQLAQNHLEYGEHYLKSFFSKVQFDFFHPTSDPNLGIYSTDELPSEDPNFLFSPIDLPSNKKFCNTSLFLNGCIRISTKPDEI